MAGTLTISTLSDGTNSTSSTNCIQGSAKAWVNFDGASSPSIRASYNVSSITWNTTGDYSINFTNAFVDNNYCATAFGQRADNPADDLLVQAYQNVYGDAFKTTSLRVVSTHGSSGTQTDALAICVSIFR